MKILITVFAIIFMSLIVTISSTRVLARPTPTTHHMKKDGTADKCLTENKRHLRKDGKSDMRYKATNASPDKMKKS